MSHLIKNLIIALVLVLLFGGIYLFMNSGAVDIGGGGFTEDEDIKTRTNQILNDTKKVSSYKLDTSIFDDDRFSTLEDYHVEVPDVATGRSNPFDIVN